MREAHFPLESDAAGFNVITPPCSRSMEFDLELVFESRDVIEQIVDTRRHERSVGNGNSARARSAQYDREPVERIGDSGAPECAALLPYRSSIRPKIPPTTAATPSIPITIPTGSIMIVAPRPR